MSLLINHVLYCKINAAHAAAVQDRDNAPEWKSCFPSHKHSINNAAVRPQTLTLITDRQQPKWLRSVRTFNSSWRIGHALLCSPPCAESLWRQRHPQVHRSHRKLIHQEVITPRVCHMTYSWLCGSSFTGVQFKLNQDIRGFNHSDS